jgi:protein tyrosine phosphatase (PTP) superfamily phosphohydrolase (DUF442 family)
MQATYRETMCHGAPVETYGDQLPSRNQPMLSLCQSGDRRVMVCARPSQNSDVML